MIPNLKKFYSITALTLLTLLTTWHYFTSKEESNSIDAH